MIQTQLHAIDLATAGDLEAAQRALEGRDDAVAVRLLGLFGQSVRERLLRSRTQSTLVHEIGNALSIAQANLEGIMDGVLEPTPERYAGMRSALEAAGKLLDNSRRPP